MDTKVGRTEPKNTAELIEEYYRRFNSQDWEGMLALLTDDVVHDINQGGAESGRDAFTRFLERMRVSYQERLENIVVMVNASGSRAAAEYLVNGKYLQTDSGLPPARGQTYVLPGGAFFDIREGRIARVTNYYNLESWLRMVGA